MVFVYQCIDDKYLSELNKVRSFFDNNNGGGK